MVVKTITVTKEAYDSFSKLKTPGESFSDLMKRVSRTIPKISDICGILKNKIDFGHLRKRTKKIRGRIGISMEERHARLRHISFNRTSRKYC